MTVSHPPPRAEDVAPDSQRRDVAEILRSLQTFTREQVAWLMAQAQRWGYELRDEEDRGFWAGYLARVAEENAAYPPNPVFCAGDVINGINQRAYRNERDAAASLPRLGDHPGGRVETWGERDHGQAAA